jgi:alpha-1,3-rhamnosyltransferase
MTTDGPANQLPSRTPVSVIVPSYNHAEFIETTLRSIIKQTLAPAELIVIDDGSTDNSRSIIDQVLDHCPIPCEVVARENRGLCATLNEGLARSAGKYFAYLGSDDVWLPDFLKVRIEMLEARQHAALAYGHVYLIDETNRIVDCTSDWADYVDGDPRPMLLQTIAPMSPSVVHRADVLRRHGWDEKARLEDYDLYLRLSGDGEFAFDSRIHAAWRRHRSNTSRDQLMMLEEQLKAQREAARRLGVPDSEIEKLQTTTKFQRAEDFLRTGDKATAAQLIFKNLKGARSASSIARTVIRLGLPFSLVRRYYESKQQRAVKRFGRLEI